MSQDNILHYNREKGCYEGYIYVQVEAELFRRLLLQEVAQDEAADLTDPTTWTKAIEKIGNITRWLNNPHTTLTPIVNPTTAIPSPVTEPLPPAQPAKRGGLRISYADIEQNLRERAKTIPPYQWETLRDPVPPGPPNSPEKKRNSYVRSDQKKVLAHLLLEWKTGIYHLDTEAARLQEEHEQHEQQKVTTKIETVAASVNGSRLR